MPTTTCPDCGQPLRPGARFCGNCGATLSASPAPRWESAPPAPGGLACPHCGKPVRAEARFCNNCGKPLAPNAAGASPDALVISAPAEESPGAAPSQPQLAPDSALAAAPAARPGKESLARRSPRHSFLWVIPLLLVAGCGLASVAGYFAARQFGWLAQETPLAVLSSTPAQAPPGAAPTLAPPTSAPVVLATPTRVVPTPTSSSFTPEPLYTATQATLPTEPLTPTQTLLTPPSAGVVLFEDLFDAGLREHWLTWGEPRATIGTGFGDNWLYLKALDPGQAGVTSRPDFVIPNAPGVAIEFDAQMDDKYSRAVLILDWDPLSFGRGPDNQDDGVIRLEIRVDQLKLFSRATQETCEQSLTATAGHTYLLRLTEAQGVALYLDGAEQPVCQLASLDLAPQPGKISFSGLGWVSRVKVSLP